MKIFLSGHGRMGRMIGELAAAKDWQVIGHADIDHRENYDTAAKADVCIDFSGVGALKQVVSYAERTGTPLVCGTTGLTEPDFALLQELSRTVPVVWAANYSAGIAVLRRMLREYAPVLAEWDKEIVEKHHNQKVDAPSGTAKVLLQELDPDAQADVVSGREGICGKREKNEIGVFALRGGTVAGEHSVFFFGEDESLTLTHTANSRRIFAAGALRAAEALVTRPPKLYTLEELIF